MATLTSLYPFIRMYAKMVPEETMNRAIIHACREFCRKTWYSRETIVLEEEAGVAYYTLEPTDTDNREVIGIVAVEREDWGPLLPITQEQAEMKEGRPCGFLYLPPDTLEIVQYPAADTDPDDLKELYVRIVLMPTLTAENLPDDVMRRHEQAIGYGAISFLTSMPLEIWSNDKVAVMANDKFNEGMRTGKSDSVFGHQPWDNQVRLRNFNI